MTEIEFLKARLREQESRFDVGDFEEVDSARGPGWGKRYCPICGEHGWEGHESVTEDAMYEHLDEKHDRVYQLALIDAQRKIVEELVPELDSNAAAIENEWGAGSVTDGQDVIRLLIQPFADHPDFDPSWRTG